MTAYTRATRETEQRGKKIYRILRGRISLRDDAAAAAAAVGRRRRLPARRELHDRQTYRRPTDRQTDGETGIALRLDDVANRCLSDLPTNLASDSGRRNPTGELGREGEKERGGEGERERESAAERDSAKRFVKFTLRGFHRSLG